MLEWGFLFKMLGVNKIRMNGNLNYKDLNMAKALTQSTHLHRLQYTDGWVYKNDVNVVDNINKPYKVQQGNHLK